MVEERKAVGIAAVEKAGKYLSETFSKTDKAEAVQEKSKLDLVSQADVGSELILISDIQKYFPNDGILSEELEGEVGSTTGYHWILDPLDGTHNFLKGFKEFGVLLALEKAGEIILGIYYLPLLQELFVAEKRKGTFLNDIKISVSPAKEFSGEMFCSDGIFRHKPKEILRDIERFCGAGCRLRVYGSSPFAFTRVALGQAAVATNRLGKPWDIAAPALIVEEAGGKATDEKGNPWQIDSENLIATNGLLHEKSLVLFE